MATQRAWCLTLEKRRKKTRVVNCVFLGFSALLLPCQDKGYIPTRSREAMAELQHRQRVVREELQMMIEDAHGAAQRVEDAKVLAGDHICLSSGKVSLSRLGYGYGCYLGRKACPAALDISFVLVDTGPTWESLVSVWIGGLGVSTTMGNHQILIGGTNYEILSEGGGPFRSLVCAFVISYLPMPFVPCPNCWVSFLAPMGGQPWNIL